MDTGKLPRLPAVYSLTAKETVTSTMDEARALAELGEEQTPDGTLIWAKEQTAGHGRRGNPWDSPRGNFYASLIVRPDVPARQAADDQSVVANPRAWSTASQSDGVPCSAT